MNEFDELDVTTDDPVPFKLFIIPIVLISLIIFGTSMIIMGLLWLVSL